MQIILFEDQKRDAFLPLVYTRSVADLRIGILTIAEKWQRVFKAEVSHFTAPWLQPMYPTSSGSTDVLLINARLLPTPDVTEAIRSLSRGEVLQSGDVMLAGHFDEARSMHQQAADQVRTYSGQVFLLETITDLFSRNGEALKLDFELLTAGRKSAGEVEATQVLGPVENLFLEEGARITASIINVKDGPVYLGAGAEILEGSMVRGGLALGEHSQLRMGAKVYGPTTIGPHCKVGGEVSNSVILGYSNKAHDGFLGNSVLGEWCNLGADTNTSNLKNNYSNVRTWNFREHAYTDTGLTFCGLVMGDHSKCGINTMFNTGTVVGVAANIFGGGFPPKYIPSFSWGGSDGLAVYDPEKALQTAGRVMARRGLELTPEVRNVLRDIFTMTAADRES